MALNAKQILNLTGAAIGTGSFSPDATYPKGVGYGRVAKVIIPIQVTRANGSSMTGVKFQIQVTRDASVVSPVWAVVPCRLRSDANGTLAASATLAAANSSTAEDAIISADVECSDAMRVVAEANGANGTTGDSCAAWVLI